MKLFIAQTLDGFIAGEGDDISHLEPYHGVDFGYEAHLASADAVVVGRRTFDVIHPRFGWTYPADLPGVVMTRRPLPAGVPSQVRAETDFQAVARAHPDAYVDGGAGTIRRFLDIGAITEARIFTLPIRLGSGVRLFHEGAPSAAPWRLEDLRAYPLGVIGATYRA